MHRFFIEPETISEDKTVWLRPSDDDVQWRYLVVSFREAIRNRNWKAIDFSIKLFVKVETWDDGNVLVEDLESRSDYYLASAYLRAGLLEKTPIIVFADSSIPWKRLKAFRAVTPQRSTRRKDGAGRHTEETARTKADQPFSRSGDPVTVAGGCLVRPKQYQADLAGERTV